MSNLSRRTLVSSAAALPALAVSAVVAGTDPIHAAIEHFKQVSAETFRIAAELDDAEGLAWKVYGHRPIALVEWRDHDAIGDSEIEQFRDELLSRDGADKNKIEAEYQDAKAREKRVFEAQEQWDVRTGLTNLRSKSEAAWDARAAAEDRLAQTYPTTPAGAAAFMDIVIADMEVGNAPWQDKALATISAALRTMGGVA
jgi:hypothetical protein